MKKLLLSPILSLVLIHLSAQTSPIFKNPIQDKRLQNNVSDFLASKISSYFSLFDFDSTNCTEYTNFIQFQIDEAGNVINLLDYINESKNIFKVYQINNSLDSIRLIKINDAMDSIIKLTSGKWIPSKQGNNMPCTSKKLLYIINYTFFANCDEFLRPLNWNDGISQLFNSNDVSLIGFFQGRRYLKH